MNSGIDVFFTQVNKPWSNAKPGNFHVNVYSPDGVEKVGVPAPSGQASIDLPPGRYLVTGTLNGIYVNFDSNETLVNVGCCERVCVTIIPRSLHFCIWWLSAAMQLIAENRKLAPEIAEMAPEAVRVLERMEKAIPAEHRQLAFLAHGLDVVKKELKAK